MKIIFIMILLLVLFNWHCNAQSKDIKTIYVEKVRDGDTFYDEYGKSYRLSEIDCPEKDQEYGENAKMFTDSIINHKTVRIQVIGYDQYCRCVCKVILDNNIDLSRLIVSNGYAWVYRKYASEHTWMIYVFAKRKHKGLWAGNPYPPFLWRKEHKLN